LRFAHEAGFYEILGAGRKQKRESDGKDRGRRESRLFPHPPQLTSADWGGDAAIFRQLIRDTNAASLGGEKFRALRFLHGREIMHMELALTTEPTLVITHEITPKLGAGFRDAAGWWDGIHGSKKAKGDSGDQLCPDMRRRTDAGEEACATRENVSGENFLEQITKHPFNLAVAS
jgi:hypothetical protein